MAARFSGIGRVGARRKRDCSRLRRQGVEAHAHLREKVFEIFRQHQSGGRTIRPPRLDAQAIGNDRERNQRDIRKLMRDLGERPRHVVGGGDDDERAKAAIDGPAACLHRIAEGVDRGIVEVDAAAPAGGRNRRPDGRYRSSSCRELTPVMSRRLPRPAASSSSASVTREVPPVKTTMPSALRSSTTSSLGNSQRKTMKPRTIAMPPRTASLMAKDLIRRVLTAALRLSIAARVPSAKFRSDSRHRRRRPTSSNFEVRKC